MHNYGFLGGKYIGNNEIRPLFVIKNTTNAKQSMRAGVNIWGRNKASYASPPPGGLGLLSDEKACGILGSQILD